MNILESISKPFDGLINMTNETKRTIVWYVLMYLIWISILNIAFDMIPFLNYVPQVATVLKIFKGVAILLPFLLALFIYYYPEKFECDKCKEKCKGFQS
jgi:hypothetical protein